MKLRLQARVSELHYGYAIFLLLLKEPELFHSSNHPFVIMYIANALLVQDQTCLGFYKVIGIFLFNYGQIA
jgi:hypothetical protein